MVARARAAAANAPNPINTPIRTRRQAKELESHGESQQLLFLENYKNGVGSMSSFDFNHNNRSTVKSASYRNIAASTLVKAKHSATKNATSVVKNEKLPEKTVAVRSARDSKVFTRKSRVNNAVAKLPPPKPTKQLTRNRPSTKPATQTCTSKKTSPKNRAEPSIVRPAYVKYVIPTLERMESQSRRKSNELKSHGVTRRNELLALTSTPRCKASKLSVHLSPPPLTQEERDAPQQLSVSVNSTFKEGHLPPLVVHQRKRQFLEMLDHLVPLRIFDGRMDYQEIKSKLSSFAADLVAAADRQHLHELPVSNHDYVSQAGNTNEPVLPGLPASERNQQVVVPQNALFSPSNNNFAVYGYGDRRTGMPPGFAMSEGRNESYGRGAFNDQRLSALLPNAPVYTQNLTRSLVVSGQKVTETNRREVIPTDALTPEQIQMLKAEGFRIQRIKEPVDKRQLTQMQRMAVDDLFRGNEPQCAGTIKN